MSTLLTKVMAIVVFFLLLHSILIFDVNTVLYGEAVSQNTLSEAQQKLEQISVNLNTLVDNLVACGNYVCRDSGLLDLLQRSCEISSPEINSSQHPDFAAWYLEVVRPILKRIANMRSSMLYQYDASMLLIDRNGAGCTDDRIVYVDIEQSKLIREILSKNGYILRGIPAYDPIAFPAMDENSLMIGYAIRRSYSNEVIGALLIAIQFPPALTEVFENPQDGYSLFLLGEDGQIVLGGNELIRRVDWSGIDLTGEDSVRLTLDGEDSYVICATVPHTRWRVVQVIPQRALFKELNALRRTSLMIIVGLSVTEFILLLLIVRHALRPLRDLNQLINKVGDGDFLISVPVHGHDEVAQISASFNAMVQRIDHLVKSNAIQHQMKEQAMLQTLRAQINPHFLLNTLNDIKWQAIIDGNRNVGSMLATLGGLLETSLGRGSTFVTLAEEIEYTEKYIRLANLRFGDRLKIRQDVDDEAKQLYIPVLILQPLLENITAHGLREDGDTHVEICARVNDDSLLITVRDDGNGITPEKLAEIHAAMADLENIPRRSIGVNNVHKRIMLRYGPEYGLTIESAVGQGTTVRMRFPICREMEVDLTPC